MIKNGKFLLIHFHYIQLLNDPTKVKEYLKKNLNHIDDIQVYAVHKNKIRKVKVKLKLENLH